MVVKLTRFIILSFNIQTFSMQIYISFIYKFIYFLLLQILRIFFLQALNGYYTSLHTLHCTTPHTSTHYNTLHCTALQYTLFHCTSVYYTTAYHIQALVEERTMDYFLEKKKAEDLLHELLPK